MKRSILKSITLFALAFLLLPILASCSGDHQHSFGKWKTDREADCSVDGIEKRSCRCGAVETKAIPAKGHRFVDGVCSSCGRSPSEGLEFHSHGDGNCSFIGRGTCTDAEIIIPAKSPSGDTVTKIMGGFFGDEVLTSLYVPESVTKISIDVFTVIPNLASIMISPNNTVYASAGGVLYNKDFTTLIKYPAAKPDTTFDIPETVTTVGIGAFIAAAELTDINIPASVKTIEMSAFRSCSSLTSITIPDGVTTITNRAFANCRSLSSINLPESITSIEEDAFSYCESLTSFTVPSGVTSISDSTFYGCTALTEIKLHDKITMIGPGAFYLCQSLKQITLPDSVARIYDRAFLSCTSLESIILPDGIQTICESTFQNCPALVSVTIPESVTKIEHRAFSECRALSSILYKGTVEQWESVKTSASWRVYAPAKGITCTDGTVEFSFTYPENQ